MKVAASASTTSGTSQMCGFCSPTRRKVAAQAAIAVPVAETEHQAARPNRPEDLAARTWKGTRAGRATNAPPMDVNSRTVIAASTTLAATGIHRGMTTGGYYTYV